MKPRDLPDPPDLVTLSPRRSPMLKRIEQGTSQTILSIAIEFASLIAIVVALIVALRLLIP